MIDVLTVGICRNEPEDFVTLSVHEDGRRVLHAHFTIAEAEQLWRYLGNTIVEARSGDKKEKEDGTGTRRV